MSALIKSVKIFNKFNQNPAAFLTLVRKAGHWNKDFKPGPFPQTEEERRAAAKKYGLLPEDYRTYREDDPLGDYPRLEEKPFEQKDIHYPYDHPEYRRNFGEPVHADIDYYEETRVGTPTPLRFSFTQMYAGFLGIMGVSFWLYFWFEDKKMFRPAMPKHMPADGNKHYTFEPAR